MVQLRAEIPEDAFTASILGTERLGNGVVIREDGLDPDDRLPDHRSADRSGSRRTAAWSLPAIRWPTTRRPASGWCNRSGRLKVPALERGSIASCEFGDDVIVIGHGGRAHALKAKIIGKREFAGYWEYVLDEALFTAPAHPQWGGAALVGQDGRLLGIGSLLVQETVEGETVQGNMIVPIDLLDADSRRHADDGPAESPAAPLARHVHHRSRTVSSSSAALAAGGPADRGGVRMGDLVLEVAGRACREPGRSVSQRVGSGRRGHRDSAHACARGLGREACGCAPPTATIS